MFKSCQKRLYKYHFSFFYMSQFWPDSSFDLVYTLALSIKSDAIYLEDLYPESTTRKFKPIKCLLVHKSWGWWMKYRKCIQCKLPYTSFVVISWHKKSLDISLSFYKLSQTNFFFLSFFHHQSFASLYNLIQNEPNLTSFIPSFCLQSSSSSFVKLNFHFTNFVKLSFSNVFVFFIL